MRHGGVLLTGSLLVLAVGGLGCRSEPEAEARAASVVEPLAAPKTGFRHLALLEPGQTRSFALLLQADQYLHLAVEQLGIDVVATVRDAAGRRLLRVDSPSGGSGSEDLFLVAGTTGRYVLAVESLEGAAGGRFALRIKALRSATDEDRAYAAAAGAYSRARLQEREDSVSEAAASYRDAAHLWEDLGEEARAAWALFWLGGLHDADPARRREGAEILSRSLDLFRRAGDERQQALCLARLGHAWWRLGEVEEAGRSYEQAAVLSKKLGDHEEWAARLNDLAVVRVRQERIHAAIDLYSRAVEILQRPGSPMSLAGARTNLGRLYASLGENRLALDQYRRALMLVEHQPESALRAVILDKLGDVLLRTDGPAAALEQFRESLELRRRRRDARGQAVTLNSIGQAWLEANRPRQALRAFEASLEVFRRQGEERPRTIVLNNLGLAYERLGQPGRARDFYRQALDLAIRQGSSLRVEETAVSGLARVARMEGQLDEAERWMEQSLETVETIRSRVWRPDLRSSYQAARQERYAFLIDLLAERHRREPGGGHAGRAFAVAERARARSLLDLLSAARHDPRPDELRRFDVLSRRINDRHRKLLAVASQGVETGALEGELTGLLENLRQTRAAVEGPRLAQRVAPPMLTLRQVQDRLLDEETLFLEYFLGEQRSFLWAVTPSATRFVTTLPGREQIEAAARRTRERMTESHRQTGDVAARQAAAELSRTILGPVADLLTRRRLVVVAPGALQAVPFAALPHPAKARLLIADHEIVSLPSASVLGALRSRLAGRRPPPGLLAVLADPVPGAADPRRLPFARQEAAAILSLAGSRQVLAASGSAASHDLVRSGRLRDFRILHFATHGLLNDLHPELSALALSGFDASGRPVEGHLRAYEVSSLDLHADLAVLSACGTGLGREVGGEGLVGLTHGFLHAGVPRLVVSLWDVDDRATSELMKRFYTALLRERLSPAQALRQAQLSLLEEERWRAPYHWAGFIFQGEWRSSL